MTTRLLFFIALIMSLAVDGSANDQWDISPYQVRVWIALDAQPEIAAWRNRLPAELDAALHLRCGAGWHVESTIINSGVDRLMFDDFESVDAETILQFDRDAFKVDKLFLVRFGELAAQKSFAIREIDGKTQVTGPMFRKNAPPDDRLVNEMADTIVEAFSPIAQIGRAENESAVLRMRAGLLDLKRETPIMPPNGTMLCVVSRKSDRLGNPLPNGIEVTPWTVLFVSPPPNKSPENNSEKSASIANELGAGVLHCQIVSGLRNPIRSRGSRRVERFGLVVRPHFEHTTIELQKRDEQQVKLAGYDIYERLPIQKNTTWIGRTDWQGHLRIARDEHPLKILYVKNGERLLARLPIIVGADQHVSAELMDDSLRLEAEGFLRGLQEEFIDLVARRKVLAMRIQRRIEDKKLDEAEGLLDELRQLETKQDMERRIREREATFQTRDKAQQDRINRLFRDTRALLAKHLDAREIDSLRDALSAARNQQRPAD